MFKFEDIHYIHFETIPSTNSWAKEHAAELDPSHLTCITAFEQTAGRGRLGRKWISPPGKNVCATLFFCLPSSFPYLINLGQILSLSCVAALREMGVDPQIKWPNDLLLNGKKLGGVLCEVVSLESRLGAALGLGMNINTDKEILELIDQPATSLKEETGEIWDIQEILKKFLIYFLKDLTLLGEQGFAPFLSQYEERLAFKNQECTTSQGDGICHSINENGTLNLRLADGTTKVVVAGEILSQ